MEREPNAVELMVVSEAPILAQFAQQEISVQPMEGIYVVGTHAWIRRRFVVSTVQPVKFATAVTACALRMTKNVAPMVASVKRRSMKIRANPSLAVKMRLRWWKRKVL